MLMAKSCQETTFFYTHKVKTGLMRPGSIILQKADISSSRVKSGGIKMVFLYAAIPFGYNVPTATKACSQ